MSLSVTYDDRMGENILLLALTRHVLLPGVNRKRFQCVGAFSALLLSLFSTATTLFQLPIVHLCREGDHRQQLLLLLGPSPCPGP